MKGFCLSFYAHEFQKHQGMVLYEWLLDLARKKEITGGSAFRAIAGYGRHGTLHEEHFFELASNVPVQVCFILTEEKAEEFISYLKKEKLNLFYILSPIECGFVADR